jgi:hypothetical protein
MSNPIGGDRVKQTAEAEHIGPDYTGDNISAKKVANYVWDGGAWNRMVQPGESASYESRNDTTSDPNLVYLGKALPGTATSATSWQIKRYNKSAGHMSFADDATTFNKSWDLRSSYGY